MKEEDIAKNNDKIFEERKEKKYVRKHEGNEKPSILFTSSSIRTSLFLFLLLFFPPVCRILSGVSPAFFSLFQGALGRTRHYIQARSSVRLNATTFGKWKGEKEKEKRKGEGEGEK